MHYMINTTICLYTVAGTELYALSLLACIKPEKTETAEWGNYIIVQRDKLDTDIM